MFTLGMVVTCMYSGIFAWHPSGEEYIKNVPMTCEIVKLGDAVHHDIAPNYMQVKVNCSKGLKDHNLVKGHTLNWSEKWLSSDECYKGKLF